MKETLYRKVEIKTEADLPKEDGDYIVHSKSYGWIGLAIWKDFENANYPEYNQYLWLLNYDWYLQPVEPEEPKQDDYDSINVVFPKGKTTHRGTLESIELKQTAEEILKDELSEYYWGIITKQDEEGHTTFKDWIIEAMEKYAGQCERESCKKCALFTHQPKKKVELREGLIAYIKQQ